MEQSIFPVPEQFPDDNEIHNENTEPNAIDGGKTPTKQLNPPEIHERFETPNIRNYKGRLDALYMSSIKKPRVEMETPSKHISRKELSSFINRTEKADENRKLKQEMLKQEEDRRIKATMGRSSKKMSKQELDALSVRLSQTPSISRYQKTEEQPNLLPPQTPCGNPHVFKRLYVQSTCKKRVLEEEDDEIPKPAASTNLSNKSIVLASKHNIQKIASVFGDKQACTHEEMLEFFKELALIDDSTSETEKAIYDKVIAQCLNEDGSYSAIQMKDIMIDSFVTNRQTRFSRLVAHRMALARVNEKNAPKAAEPEEDPEQLRIAAKMQKETLERLLASKPVVEAEPEVVDTFEPAISKSSIEILSKSERTRQMLDMPLEERDRLLLEKRDSLVSRLKKELQRREEIELKKQPANLGEMPSFYESIPEEKKRRAHKEEKEEEPTFKPKTNNYEEYKRRKSMAGRPLSTKRNEEMINKSVKRLALARLEQNRIQSELDVRAAPVCSKRRTTFADWKKKTKKTRKSEAIEVNETADVDAFLGI